VDPGHVDCRYRQSVRASAEVDGASGWITFVYLILHAYAAVILGVMLLLVWLLQYVIA